MISSDGIVGSSSSASSRCNIVVLGSGSVGKSCLVIQYVQGVFLQYYDPTIMDVLIKVDTIDGSTATVSLVDTTGQREFADHRAPYIRDADGVVFVFSVVDGNSLQELPVLLDQVAKARSTRPDCPFLVVGNKNDLGLHRTVSTAEGEKFAEMAWKRLSGGQAPLPAPSALPYLETSAKIAGDARLLCHSIVRMVRAHRRTGRVCNLDEATPKSTLSTTPAVVVPPVAPVTAPEPAVVSDTVPKQAPGRKVKSLGNVAGPSPTSGGLLEFPEQQNAEITPSPVASPSSSVTSMPAAAQKKKKKSCTML